VEDEAPAWLDRAAVEHGPVGRLPRVDAELIEQPANPDPGSLVTDADPDRSILVMDAHRDHRPFETRIADAGHGQQ
jgi:hypothetical protein